MSGSPTLFEVEFGNDFVKLKGGDTLRRVPCATATKGVSSR